MQKVRKRTDSASRGRTPEEIEAEAFVNLKYKVDGGDVVDPLPEDAPFFVKDYYDYQMDFSVLSAVSCRKVVKKP